MPIFLTNDQFYRVLQRELPPDVFPDGSPSAFFHNADMHSAGYAFDSASVSLSGIYEESFPQSCSGRIGDWEVKVFGTTPNSTTLTLQQRIDRVLTKLRTHLGITKADAYAIVDTAVPGMDFAIWEWSQGQGMWVLGVSRLGLETRLGYGRRGGAIGPTICDEDPADFGMTTAEWEAIREGAYTYEVRIYNKTLTTDERAAITSALLQFGRVTCQFIITDGLTDADK